MNSALTALISGYNPQTSDEYLRALREIVQHISLLGLWRAKFFERACFYGGTALRIFYGLPRYSEDMDFSLIAPDATFSIEPYAKGIENELSAFGFSATVGRKEKNMPGRVESAFVKTGTLQSMLLIDAPPPITDRLHRESALKVKIEVDTDPPPAAASEVRSLLIPIPFQVRLYMPPSLFSGKLHAVLCRAWKSRLKGRDFYDFLWFIGMKIPCNLKHLQARMKQSGHLNAHERLDREKLLALLDERFHAVDFRHAAADVLPFIQDPQAVELWSKELFCTSARDIRVE